MSRRLDSFRAARGYVHVVLSPHFDDAALSLGGSIAGWRAAGEPVLVVTFCAAAPANTPDTPIVRWLQGPSGLDSPAYVSARRQEDSAAMRCLAADYLWLEGLDAIYRAPEAYADDAHIFAEPRAGDPLVAYVDQALAELALHLPEAQVYAPLAVGSHVDHVVVSRGAERRLEGLIYYEDLPYALKAKALAATTTQREVRPRINDVGATLAVKLEAVAAYTTQVPMLFGKAGTMRQRLSDHAALVMKPRRGHGERLWAR
jgi:LmbE family N-acetylglucosaminyl deacetylase